MSRVAPRLPSLVPVDRALVPVVAALVLVTGCAESLPGPGADGDPFVLRGQVVAADGGDVEGLTVTWRAPGAAGNGDAATVGADGTFEISTRTGPLGELLVDGTPRRFHPFLYPFQANSLVDATLVLVPLRWTIRSGEYAGQVVDTSLDPAVDDDAGNYLYSYFWGQGDPRDDPVRYLLDLATWPADRMPATVAFDRQGGANPVSAQDSIDIWAVLDRMEAVFGLDLFEPRVADPAWWPEPWDAADPGLIPGVIRVVLDPPSWFGILLADEDPDVWEEDLGAWAPDGPFQRFRVRRRLIDGGALIVGAFQPLQLADGLIRWETVLMHEMLHVMGAGHTCRIPSPQGPCMRTAEPSPEDVAYMELLRETIRLEREHDTFLGVVPALIGERRVLFGASALPAVGADSPWPGSSKIRSIRRRRSASGSSPRDYSLPELTAGGSARK